VSTGIDEELSKFGVAIEHHFGGGCYVKETHIPAGTLLAQHAHQHDHLSWLSSGKVVVTVDGVAGEPVTGPCMLLLAAHQVHSVRAVTDAVWLCIWKTDETDPLKIDSVLGG
jgi:hypothetical protein